MVIVETDRVSFPRDRKTQYEDLQALAGDALLRGDVVAWEVLHRASTTLKYKPDFDTPEGRAESAQIRKRVRNGLS